MFDFNMEALTGRVKVLNPAMDIIPISAKTDVGMDEWVKYLCKAIENLKASC
jgi:hydrogenase nickel incorporation protein HypB